MIVTPNQHSKINSEESLPTSSFISEADLPSNELAQQWMPGRSYTHHPKAGLNPLVDACAHLFSIMGKMKQLDTYRHLHKLQKELIQDINSFQDIVKTLGYNSEYVLVCRYALCATFDDIIANTSWGGQGQWDHYNLLAVYKQDTQHQEKFFIILERLVKNPALYIDLMEFMYLCLSLGFKGHYRTTEYSHYQLDQITDTLYQHIRIYRGDFNKKLSPLSIKTKAASKLGTAQKLSVAFPLILSACVILIVFMSLAYLLNNLSNDAYQDLLPIKSLLAHESE